jgi:pimeloyl-ACP methyl ester carboxylesterase
VFFILCFSILCIDKSNGNFETRKILCLHGWLDNAASFNRLAPVLINSFSESSEKVYPTELIALDFPGHGLSGHKSTDGPPQLLAEYTYYVAECLEALKWCNVGSPGRKEDDKITIIGHSMGGVLLFFYIDMLFDHSFEIIILLPIFVIKRGCFSCIRSCIP